MPRGRKFKAEEIIAKLREAEVELARGKKIPAERAQRLSVVSNGCLPGYHPRADRILSSPLPEYDGSQVYYH